MRVLTPLMLLLATFVSATIPAGWMPKVLGNGHMVLVLCTGDGMVEVVVDDTGAPVPMHEHSDDDRSPCAFSALADAAALYSAPQALPVRSALRARWQHEGFTHESAGFHRRYDARGPPALS